MLAFVSFFCSCSTHKIECNTSHYTVYRPHDSVLSVQAMMENCTIACTMYKSMYPRTYLHKSWPCKLVEECLTNTPWHWIWTNTKWSPQLTTERTEMGVLNRLCLHSNGLCRIFHEVHPRIIRGCNGLQMSVTLGDGGGGGPGPLDAPCQWSPVKSQQAWLET